MSRVLGDDHYKRMSRTTVGVGGGLKNPHCSMVKSAEYKSKVAVFFVCLFFFYLFFFVSLRYTEKANITYDYIVAVFQRKLWNAVTVLCGQLDCDHGTL